MAGDYGAVLYFTCGLAGVLAIGFSFPPLTGPGGAAGSERVQVLMQQERTYCQSRLTGVDCACFAGVTGHVLAHETSPVAGAHYAKAADLARGQAMTDC